MSQSVGSSVPGPLRALMMLGSSSVVTVIAGIVSSKIAALIIGTEGVGLMALVLTVVSLANVIIVAGVGQALIRTCGAEEAGPEHGLVWHSDWIQSARRIVFTTSAGVVVCAAVISPIAAEPLFGEGAQRWWLPGVALAAAFWGWIQLQISTLVAHHLVSVTARVAIATAFISPAVNTVAFSVWGVNGVVPGAIAANACIALVVSLAVRRVGRVRRSSHELRTAATNRVRVLLRTGLPLIPVSLLGGISVLTMLLVVDRQLSRDEVGYYRAATTISLGYIALLNTSVTQDFFPRLSRTIDDPREFGRVCNEQIRLILLLAAPIVIAVNVALPVIVPLLFSREFAPATDILEWQIAGDLLRLTTSILATALLVRSGSLARLAPEVVGAVSFVALSVVSLELFGLSGLGVGYLANYLVYFGILCLALAFGGYRPSRSVLGHLLVAVGGAVSIPVTVALVGSDFGRLVGVPIVALLGAHTFRELGLARFVPARHRHEAPGKP